jgi:hypothetical protein
MQNPRLAAGAVGLCLAIGAAAAAAAIAADSAAAPKTVTITERDGLSMKPNRYLEDKLRWTRDVYRVRSGGTITVVNTVAKEGPHTFTVVRPSELPRTGRQLQHCTICARLARAHGATPGSSQPPKFQFLENGVGQNTPPNVDRPGDSGITGQGRRGEQISFTVTAKKGKTLYFMCLIHPWMQARVRVG